MELTPEGQEHPSRKKTSNQNVKAADSKWYKIKPEIQVDSSHVHVTENLVMPNLNNEPYSDEMGNKIELLDFPGNCVSRTQTELPETSSLCELCELLNSTKPTIYDCKTNLAESFYNKLETINENESLTSFPSEIGNFEQLNSEYQTIQTKDVERCGCDHILNYARDAVINFNEGKQIYLLDETYRFSIITQPLLSTIYKLPRLNPRHTKLTWKRFLKSRKKSFVEQIVVDDSSIHQHHVQPDESSKIFNQKNYLKSIKFLEEGQNNITVQSKHSNNSCRNGQKVLSQVQHLDLRSTRSTQTEISMAHERNASKKNMSLIDSNNNPENCSTSEESFELRQVPQRFLNSREFSHKEKEYLLRIGVDEVYRFRTSSESCQTSSLTSVSSYQSHSDSECVMRTGEVHLTDRLTKLFNDLKSLWFNVNSEAEIVPAITEFDDLNGDHKMRLVNLCSLIVKEMDSEWRNLASSTVAKDKLLNLEVTNKLLKQQLETARTDQTCLETELKFVTKEKTNLSQEVKSLSMQLAEVRRSEKPKATKSSSSVSLGFETLPLEHTPAESNVEKREEDFNNLMDVIKSHHTDLSFYQDELEKYSKDVAGLENEVNLLSKERSELGVRFSRLSKEHKTLLEETRGFEDLLTQAFDEKVSTGHGLNGLLQMLIDKLHKLESTGKGKEELMASKIDLLEGALQTVQDQNKVYKETIAHLKYEVERLSETVKADIDLENTLQESQKQVQEVVRCLNEKLREAKCSQEKYKQKEHQWKENCKALAAEKDQLQSLVDEKDFEWKKQNEAYHGLEKRNLRNEKRVQDVQKCNDRFKRELQDYKQNMESLNQIIHELRTKLNEQKTQWVDRIRAANDEALQAKELCRWLQTQVEHTNALLADANERIKSNERDKSNLAQQVLSNEEERKLVDRKLQELRIALQGDSVLREALMERNEALQNEINRLRHAKLTSGGKFHELWKEDGDFAIPPATENNNNLHPTYEIRTPGDKGIIARKNCYTAGTNRRPIEVPRSTVSMHSSAGLGTTSTIQGTPGTQNQY